jgi:hypothetical protein
MLKTWPVFLKEFVSERTVELDEKIFSRDRKYVRLKEEYLQVLEQFQASLGPEETRLFLEYDSADGNWRTRQCDLFYQQGLIDGLRLGYLVDRLRRKR